MLLDRLGKEDQGFDPTEEAEAEEEEEPVFGEPTPEPPETPGDLNPGFRPPAAPAAGFRQDVRWLIQSISLLHRRHGCPVFEPHFAWNPEYLLSSAMT